MNSRVSTILMFVQKIKTGILCKAIRDQQQISLQTLKKPKKTELARNVELGEKCMREFEAMKSRTIAYVRKIPPL